ncbi:MAG: hypothetical protein O7B26_12625 [Planctomycetota bacterium]|nr:hypothetical protein [Planctomycetota bacterium]
MTERRKPDRDASGVGTGTDAGAALLARRHLCFGWWGLLAFLTLGGMLEVLHGFKIRFYLDTSNETRRLMWTLAHAHGTLLALVNVVFGITLTHTPDWSPGARNLASRLLLAASLMLPAGFLLGGVFIHGGDPGLGILLVPLGAILLFPAILLTARAVTARPRPGPKHDSKSDKRAMHDARPSARRGTTDR